MAIGLTSITSQFGNLSSQINRSSTDSARDVARLSSGNRITRAGDDVASLSVATRMRTAITGIRSAALNISQAASALDVAEGGLQQIEDITQRMLGISVMAVSGQVTDAERGYLNQELIALEDEIQRLSQSTQFNGVKVLDPGPQTVEIIPDEGDTIVGSANNDTLTGTADNDDMTGFDGDDIINAGAGDDIIRGGTLSTPGLRGFIYDTPVLSSVPTVETFIASATPIAEFVSSALDYPQGAINSQNSTIGAFLGTDAGTLTAPIGGTNADTTAYIFEGQLSVATAGTFQFNFGSDDGFRIEIDGVSESAFLGVRGFSFTNANITLTEGEHDIKILFFERTGGEGMELFSDVAGGGVQILDNSVLSFRLNDSDGNDTIDAGAGEDIIEYEGARSDYTVTEIAENTFEVVDNRTSGTSNGTDTIINGEFLRFTDGDLDLSSLSSFTAPTPFDGVLSFNILDLSGETFDYEVVDATRDALFGEDVTLSLLTKEEATATYEFIQTAANSVTGLRAYVGSKRSQADIISGALSSSLVNQDAARAVIADTDIVSTSTSFANSLVKNNLSISIAAQANNLREDAVTSILDTAIQVGG